MLPFMLGGVVWLAATGQGHFAAGSLADSLLLVSTGVVTAVPLLFFAAAARRLRLSSVGMFQYIAPTTQFVIAVFLFGEAFTTAYAITFALIWRAGRFSDDESVHPAIQQFGRRSLIGQFEEIESSVGNGWLVGDRFTAADGYALIFFRWGRRIGMDMKDYPKWAALNQRLLAELSVQRVVEKEELETELFQPAG